MRTGIKSLCKEERGVSMMIGAMLMLLILATLYGFIQAYEVPNWNKDVEYAHLNTVHDDMITFKSNVESIALSKTPKSSDFQMGVRYPNRIFLVNPGIGVAGSLTSNSINITVEYNWIGSDNVTHDDTRTYSSSRINYEVYGTVTSPKLVYENGLVISDYGNANVTTDGQPLIVGDQIYIPLVIGNQTSLSSMETQSVNIKPLPPYDIVTGVTWAKITLDTSYPLVWEGLLGSASTPSTLVTVDNNTGQIVIESMATRQISFPSDEAVEDALYAGLIKFNTLSGIATVAETDIATSNVTYNDATTLKHGFLPRLSGSASQFLNGLGNWAAISASTAWGSITGTLSNQTDLQNALNAKVPSTTTVNGHALSTNVTVTKTDIGLGNVTNDAQVTSVNGTSPISSSGGTTPTISIATANTTTTGALTSTDWNTFNNKQNALGYTPTNNATRDQSNGFPGLTLFKINFKNVLNTFTSFFTNSNTASRTYTFQDRDGIIADNTDLADKVNTSVGTAKGDLIGYTATNSPARIPVGTEGQVLMVVSANNAGVGWANAPGGNDQRVFTDALTAGQQFDITNSTTLVNVSNLDVSLTAGTYVFKYYVIYRSSTATSGIRYSINYSGTNGAFVWNWRWIDASATASTAAPDQDQLNSAGSVNGGFSSRAKSTTTRGTTLSVDTINADMLVIIEGVFVATGPGDLELWTASEITGASVTTSTMPGTSVIVTKTN